MDRLPSASVTGINMPSFAALDRPSSIAGLRSQLMVQLGPAHAIGTPVVQKEKCRRSINQGRLAMAASSQTTLTLDDQEKAYLKGLLEIDLSETRVEVRRADEPEYHDELRKREEMTRNLLERLKETST
jgi:hypothetical protein